MPFDTLKMARRLEASGMASAVAAGTAEALAEAMSGAELATKANIDGLKAEIEAHRGETKGDFTKVATKADIAEVRGEIGILRKDMEIIGRDITIKLGSIVVMGIGVLLAAIRYLPPHP